MWKGKFQETWQLVGYLLQGPGTLISVKLVPLSENNLARGAKRTALIDWRAASFPGSNSLTCHNMAALSTGGAVCPL